MMRTMSAAQNDETASAAKTFPVHEKVIGDTRAIFVQRTRQGKQANVGWKWDRLWTWDRLIAFAVQAGSRCSSRHWP